MSDPLRAELESLLEEANGVKKKFGGKWKDKKRSNPVVSLNNAISDLEKAIGFCPKTEEETLFDEFNKLDDKAKEKFKELLGS
tara:strand:+ start:3271 stop:3519 length:249 start_codon:yes stop_codon:yes gene_type:complete